MTETLAPVALVALNHLESGARYLWRNRMVRSGLRLQPHHGTPLLQAEAAANQETGHIFGPRFQRAYHAHLLASNGVGLEVFRFVVCPRRVYRGTHGP
jgi:hypothetical protein